MLLMCFFIFVPLFSSLLLYMCFCAVVPLLMFLCMFVLFLLFATRFLTQHFSKQDLSCCHCHFVVVVVVVVAAAAAAAVAASKRNTFVMGRERLENW